MDPYTKLGPETEKIRHNAGTDYKLKKSLHQAKSAPALEIGLYRLGGSITDAGEWGLSNVWIHSYVWVHKDVWIHTYVRIHTNVSRFMTTGTVPAAAASSLTVA